MPGILGIINKKDNPVDKYLFNNMQNCLFHQKNFYGEQIFFKNGAIGYIDIEKYKTVNYRKFENIHFFVQGKIYEYDMNAIKNSVTEYDAKDEMKSLFVLYKNFGTDICKHIKGEFLIVVADNDKKKYIIMTDRFATRFIYYADTSDYFVFAPEIKSILKCPFVKKNMDSIGMGEFLSFEYPLENRTFLEQVKVIRPAEIIEISAEKTGFQTYWDFLLTTSEKEENEDYYIEKCDNLMEKAIHNRFQKGNKPLIMLSGGLDSRLIA
ncbi:hypothetical protein KA977_14280, partial [Candidatus Dependentiae bacterium]|nr:hypothetical protein [Candidatus Dependentiae bacterium]